jgi:hypothetical protein
MKSRDERVALMNEILGAIRMLKVSISISSQVSIADGKHAVHGLGEEFREACTQNS